MSLNRHPELRGFGDAKTYRRVYWQKRGRENIAAGLTWNGTPRHRVQRPDLAGLDRTARHTKTNQERAERFMARNLTWRGKPYKRKLSRATALNVEQSWKQLRAEMGQIEVKEPSSNWGGVWRDAA
jgi:hypothetical protein